MNGQTAVGLIVMVGGGGRTTGVERSLRQARQAAAQDLIRQAVTSAGVSPVVVVTDDAGWLERLAGLDIEVEITELGRPFHFGQALTQLIARYQLEACFYTGGGSAPLLSAATLAHVVRQVVDEKPILVTNNLHSSDWAAFAPADALLPLDRWLEHDNALAWVWQEWAGFPVRVLPRSAATQMDIDTPFDLLALARHPGIGSHLRAFLDRLDWPAPHLDAALDVLRREASHVIIAGRVSSWAWGLLERNTRSWVRVFAEERGMRASGRQARGEVQCLLNDYLDLVGVEQFFTELGRMAEAVLLDSRVILASRRLWPSDADRFHSDLLMAERVSEPFLRALTVAARGAPMPVVLGGHSLVSGGLAVLLEGGGLVSSN